MSLGDTGRPRFGGCGGVAGYRRDGRGSFRLGLGVQECESGTWGGLGHLQLGEAVVD